MNKRVLTSIVALFAASIVAVSSVSPAIATSSVSTIAPLEITTGIEGVTFSAVSDDGSLVAVKDEYTGVTVYEVPSMTRHDISTGELGSDDTGSLVFSPDNNWLYIADYQGSGVIVIDLTNFSFDHRIDSADLGQLWMPAVSPDGDYLFAREYGGTIYKIDLSSETVVGEIDAGGSGDIMSLCISGDGTKLYSPTKGDALAVIDTASMTVDAQWIAGSGVRTYQCSLDNDGNIIVAMTGHESVAKFAPDGSFIESDYPLFGNITSAVASCDTIYIGEDAWQNRLPTLNLSTLATLDTLAPSTGDFYGESASRSADGSVIAISGYYANDGLVIVLSPDCVGANSGGGNSGGGHSNGGKTEALAFTGIDPSTAIFSATVGLGLLVFGALGMVINRRRKA